MNGLIGINQMTSEVRTMNKEVKVFYECDRRECENCNEKCKHTDNVMHAKNFKREGSFLVEEHQRECNDVVMVEESFEGNELVRRTTYYEKYFD